MVNQLGKKLQNGLGRGFILAYRGWAKQLHVMW